MTNLLLFLILLCLLFGGSAVLAGLWWLALGALVLALVIAAMRWYQRSGLRPRLEKLGDWLLMACGFVSITLTGVMFLILSADYLWRQLGHPGFWPH